MSATQHGAALQVVAQGVLAVVQASVPTVKHAAVILPVGDSYRNVCCCGWISQAHLTEWNAQRDSCAVLSAERERAQRAVIDGRHVVHALHVAAQSSGQKAQLVSEADSEGTDGVPV